MKLNGNTSKRSAAARREAADFAAQERSAHRSGANLSLIHISEPTRL